MGQLLVAEFAEHAGDGFARGANELCDLFMSQRDLDPQTILGGFGIGGPFEE